LTLKRPLFQLSITQAISALPEDDLGISIDMQMLCCNDFCGSLQPSIIGWATDFHYFA